MVGSCCLTCGYSAVVVHCSDFSKISDASAPSLEPTFGHVCFGMSSCHERCWTRKFDSNSEAFKAGYFELQSDDHVLRQTDLRIDESWDECSFQHYSEVAASWYSS